MLTHAWFIFFFQALRKYGVYPSGMGTQSGPALRGSLHKKKYKSVAWKDSN